MFFLGIDLGSSSVKLAIIEAKSGKRRQLIQIPEQEMSMDSPEPGWAEQDPNLWWSYVCQGISQLLQNKNVHPDQIKGIGIGYQMHGLVLIDAKGQVLRNSIIWCDSRAIQKGEELAEKLGEDYYHRELLNHPGNFTAAKLAWVKANEPELFDKTRYFMLPGDYLALRFSSDPTTTITGLSEGILWNYAQEKCSEKVLEAIGIRPGQVPRVVPVLGDQVRISSQGAEETGLLKNTPILYRAGDQPNNAMSLQVMNPGEVAATGGTSGVVYAVTDNKSIIESSRVNNFVHVNHVPEKRVRIGKLLCINGCGILYRWVLNNFKVSSYEEMNTLASEVEIGSEGLTLIPFGNGAERMLLNEKVGGHIIGLDFNRHTKAHVCRAALEGIAFSFYFGFEILKKEGIETKVIRTGNDNLFRSELFGKTVATLLDVNIEVYDTTGAEGAARACALALGRETEFFGFMKNDHVKTITPFSESAEYKKAFNRWRSELETRL